MNKIFITTTLPYINGASLKSPGHIGHALEFIQGDVLARYLRLRGKDVRFNVGVDEHGLKVYKKAAEIGVPTQEYCDTESLRWVEFLKKLNISYTIFYRTSSEQHKKNVQDFWNKGLLRGDVYKKKYIGLYCIGCESFKLEKDLINGNCPDHDSKPEKIEEENWFFKITKYKESILKWLDSNHMFLSPFNKNLELRNIIENSEDISVSRLKKNVPWGISVPNDADQVLWVWYEALLNYIFSAEEYWNSTTIQISGPDNIRWQGHIFQTFLESANLPHTTKLLVHGTVLDGEGKKMSKSLGNVVDPIDQLQKFGLDPVRYYAIVGLTTYGDGKWSEKELIELYNDHLANNYGNLLSRVTHLVSTKNIETHESLVEGSFKLEVLEYLGRSNAFWDNYDFHNAVREINNLVSYGNKYINDEKPWSSENGTTPLNNLYYLLIIASEALLPVIPDKATEALNSLKEKKKIVLFPRIV